MFHRLAAKGPALMLGLLAALMPASHASPRSGWAAPHMVPAVPRAVLAPPHAVPSAPGGTVRTSAKAVPRLLHLPVFRVSARLSGPGKAVSPFQFKPGTPQTDAAAATPLKALPWLAARDAMRANAAKGVKSARKTSPRVMNMGNSATDFQITTGGNDELEPQFLLNSLTYSFVYAANPGASRYPFPSTSTTGTPDPPEPSGYPDFLTGLPDYHIYYRDLGTNKLNQVIVGSNTDAADLNRGEQFEPTVGGDGTLVFSAFLAAKNGAYQPQSVFADPTTGDPLTYNFHGLAVRTINVSGNGLAMSQVPDTATIDHTLVPEAYGVLAFTDPTNPDATPMYQPVLLPDASPAVYPLNSRYVAFVSERSNYGADTPMYSPKDASTHYTSLWLWDTMKSPTDAGYVTLLLSVPGMSILQPRFSPDGQYLAFTETDVPFDAADVTGFGYAKDPVFDFDVSKAQLAQPFKARIFAASVAIQDPTGNNPVSVNFGKPAQVTTFADAAGNPSRDMMPFWGPLNQLGFSTDRSGADDVNGFATTVPTDPASALFDIYTFRFPYVEGDPRSLENQALPDQTARRQALGFVATDDTNELKGDWGVLFPDNTTLGLLAPSLIYQSDTSGTAVGKYWDLWGTDKTAVGTPTGTVLTGIPVIEVPDGNGGTTVTREAQPGSYVKISVFIGATPPDDAVVQVLVKDPDEKIFNILRDDQINDGIETNIYNEIGAFPIRFTQSDVDDYTMKFGTDTDAPQIGSLVNLKADPAKGTGWFSGKFYTPAERSDYLLDVLVTTAGATGISDNIGGFSTATFVPYSRILVVSDFTAGQQSIPYTINAPTTSGIPTESYFTYRPHANTAHAPGAQSYLLLTTVGPGFTDFYQWGDQNAWNVLGPRIEWQDLPTTQLNAQTGRLDVTQPGTLNANDTMVGRTNKGPLFPVSQSPFNNFYDLWRTQCHDAITMSVLQNYLPYTHTQPNYPTGTRTQRVADRCVLWFAPHAARLNGNAGSNSEGFTNILNTRIGTIANVHTQQELLTYLQKNGRLALTGDDVAYALSGDGSAGSTTPGILLLNAMHVAYGNNSGADSFATPVFPFDRGDPMTAPAQTADLIIPYSAYDVPIVHFGVEPAHPNVLYTAPWFTPNPTLAGGGLHTHPVGKAYNNDTHTREDGAFTNLYIDSVQPFNGGVGIYTNNDGTTSGVQFDTALSATDNTAVSKTAFFGFGIEGLHREYRSASDDIDTKGPHFHAEDLPAELVHNIVDYFTTTSIIGTVKDTNGGGVPVKGALVLAYDKYSGNPAVRGSATTDASGAYYMDGLDPSVYNVRVYRAGFKFGADRTVLTDTRGDAALETSGTTLAELDLQSVPSGSLSGTVTDATNNQPLAGITVTATDIQGVYTYTTTTDANGNYTFSNVQAGQYIVTATPANPVNGVNYDTVTSTKNVTVNSTANTTYNIALTRQTVAPDPATLTVKVQDLFLGKAAQGAVVTVYKSGQTTPYTDPATTGISGVVSFALVAGTYDVTVSYGTPSKMLKQTISLVADTNPDSGTLNVLLFQFGAVLHTFPGNEVLMVSSPYTYTSRFSTVLNIPDTNTDKTGLTDAPHIVAWNVSSQAFVPYPTSPADTFHPGRGYGFKLPQDGKVNDQGATAAVSGGAYRISLGTGWNLIGDPFGASVLWATSDTNAAAVQVTLQSDTTHKYSVQDASNSGLLLSPLWGGYNVYNGAYLNSYTALTNTPASGAPTVLEPWYGYWVKAGQPLYLYVPAPSASSSASVVALKNARNVAAPLQPSVDTWAVNVTALSGTAQDYNLALGLDSRAGNSANAAFHMAKPGQLDSGGAALYTSFQDNGTSYATDIRRVSNAQIWTFNVASAMARQNVTLTWSPYGKLPQGGTVTLVDTLTGKRINMAAGGQYTYRAGGAGGRNFRVEYHAASSTPGR